MSAFKNNPNLHDVNKNIEEYCEDIINARYYDLSKLKELNVIKAVNDENNQVKWYIDGSEQVYTNYRELRKGLVDYMWRLHNGKFFGEKEIFYTLDKMISSGIPTMILSKSSSLQVSCNLVSCILSQVKNTDITYSGIIRLNEEFNPVKELQKEQWISLENRMSLLFNSPLWINEVKDYSIAAYKSVESSIRNKNIKHIIIDSFPNQTERSNILEWAKTLGINVYFTDLSMSNPYNTINSESRNHCGIFSENHIHTRWN